jgi:uncharacterized membrane protein YhaH (DUF805 family)
MSVTELLFSFQGRANRAQYWLAPCLLFPLGFLLGLLAPLFKNSAPAVVLTIFLGLVVLMLWVGLALTVKRWHDRGKSGWMCLISLIPIIGPIWQLVECGFLPGNSGSNEHGPRPQSWVQGFFASDERTELSLRAPVPPRPVAAAAPVRRQQPVATVSPRQPTFGKMGRPRGVVS